MTLHVGIDVGGTFTDAVAVREGIPFRGKAFSTKDVSTGILDALTVLAERLEIDVDGLLAAVDRFVLGNTIVTNAVDEHRYARVALLTTTGFRDTLRIARSARTNERDPQAMAPAPEIVARDMIFEVDERVDQAGRVVTPLRADVVAEAVDAAVAAGAESLAVCFLWSFRNPSHEQAIAAYAQQHHPGLPVSLSSALTPVYREYERTVTTVLDAGVKPIVADHFASLAETLSARGLRVPVQIMQVHGGFLSVEATAKAPISMFNSGPVGGVTGARILGAHLGRNKILTADMGGTSLDAAAVVDGELRVLPRAEIGGFPTSLTAVDIETIGAGGGSLAWVDGRGLLRVGPHSAGSRPGPACYGTGGTRPAVTDAAVLLGLIDPDYYLGGTVSLDVDLAASSIREHIGDPLGQTPQEAAQGIYRLATSQMANALRRITVNRGHDPREFSLVAFGGACGLFAAPLAREAGVSEVIVPRSAAVFSAYGLMHADSVFSTVKTTPWTMDAPAEHLEQAFAGLEAEADAWFDQEGIPVAEREIYREADVKFAGQIFEVTTRLSRDRFDEAAKPELRRAFVRDYEREFGTGTAWTETDIVVVNVRLRAVGRSDIQTMVALEGSAQGGMSVGERRVLEPDATEVRSVPTYRGFTAREPVRGPLLIEEPDTNIYVPRDASVRVIDSGDLLISLDRRDAAVQIIETGSLEGSLA